MADPNRWEPFTEQECALISLGLVGGVMLSLSNDEGSQRDAVEKVIMPTIRLMDEIGERLGNGHTSVNPELVASVKAKYGIE